MGVLGKMLSDVKPFQYELGRAAASRYEELRDVVEAIFHKGKAAAIGLKVRVAAEALDQPSQERLPLPHEARYWVNIPEDVYTIGGDKEAYNSLPKRRITLGAFKIARFPVTVYEYGKHLDDTDSERPPNWDEQSQHPGRPVTRVTWHEAQRYCAWAKCKLPTDEQWEATARGIKARIYPWVPENPDEFRANFDSNVRDPSPVGLFPAGAPPEGVEEIAGNVWEWTRSDFDAGKSGRGGLPTIESSILTNKS